MVQNRVSTGIPGLDPLIEGGLPAGKSYLITGGPGTGKSIFCLQFLLRGLVNEEKGVYVAVDEKPKDVIEQAASLGWDLSPYIDKKMLLILDASPYFTSRMGAAKNREVDVSKIVSDLSSYIKRMEALRVVIDPVGPFLSSTDPMRAQEHARMLVHLLQSYTTTTNLFTSYYNPEANGAVPHGMEEFLTAGVILLRVAQQDNRLCRTLLVQKMRGTALELSEHQFTISKTKGIILKPSL